MGLLRMELWLIKEKFPHQDARIDELYERDADFRALCADYLLCSRILHAFERDVSQKKYAAEEYESIRSELEKELTDYMSSE